jgi:hypothetical protein
MMAENNRKGILTGLLLGNLTIQFGLKKRLSAVVSELPLLPLLLPPPPPIGSFGTCAVDIVILRTRASTIQVDSISVLERPDLVLLLFWRIVCRIAALWFVSSGEGRVFQTDGLGIFLLLCVAGIFG